jgi:hypothetical protein
LTLEGAGMLLEIKQNRKTALCEFLSGILVFYTILWYSFPNNSSETNKMKKINVKVVTFVIMILSFLAVGGIAMKTAIGPSGFGQGDESDGGGG